VDVPARDLRRGDATREQILDAADEFLRTHPFRDLTVSGLMQTTAVSRPAFYQYFRDRYDIVEGLIERISESVAQSGGAWSDGSGGADNCAAAMKMLARTLAPNGYAVKAITDASACDERVERLWRRGFMKQYVDFGILLIQREQMSGNTPSDLDPVLAATALSLLVPALAAEVFSRPDVDASTIDAVGDTWARIWCATLYPSDVGRG
jgi:TetR/AcrR family transcriptional regulator, ethionamide resistance regulator